ncbi:MAG: chemotaxis protein CheW [Thermoguttaceae bacterium]|jgi:purine-binding chemotaxis protein CheW
MSTITTTRSVRSAGEVEFVTFYVGDLLIGIDIHNVEEINRQVEVTPVPQAPPHVRGVINLRGEVVTVVDLRKVLEMGRTEINQCTRTVVVNSGNEEIGMLVDRVADVVLARADQIDTPPANISGVDGRFFKGVYKLDKTLLIVLDVDAAIAVKEPGLPRL